MVYSQLIIFIVYIIAGIFISFLFDFFRILRICFKTNNLGTYIEDIIFWIMVFTVLFLISSKFKYMDLRFYNFFGLLIGGTLYFSTISKNVIKYGVKILGFFKKILKDFVNLCRIKK